MEKELPGIAETISQSMSLFGRVRVAAKKLEHFSHNVSNFTKSLDAIHL